LFAVVILLLLLLIPLLEKQIAILIAKIPQILAWIQHKALPYIEKYFGIKEILNVEGAKAFLAKHWTAAGSVATTIWQIVFYSGYTIFVVLFNLVMIPVVTFYLLRDWTRIIQGTRHLFPRSIEPLLVHLVDQCNEVLGAFFRGQLLVMLCLGIYYIAGLWLVGVQLALLIGLIIGIISVVPYLGFIVGILLAIVATLVQFHDWIHLVYVIIVFLIGIGLENAVLAPLLVGDRIGLHPVAVIFAILAGGQLFGFTGVLLALPVAAIIMVLLRYAKDRYLASELYDDNRAVSS